MISFQCRLWVASAAMLLCAAAQSWDAGTRITEALANKTDSRLNLTFESRGRYESRSGNAFGRSVDLDTGLIRTRLGLSYTPVRWFKISGMLQDSRAPWYGPKAPNSIRDPVDLHEAYVELFPAEKTGPGLTVGRKMLDYGEGRLIGTPQWSNLARTYDHARLYYRLTKARLEVLLVSPVKIRIGEFNRPDLGDRVWGTYDSFPNFYRTNLLDVYILRHDQNRPGGFTGGSRAAGTDKLGVNTFGFRLAGPVGHGVQYSLESAFQTGQVGPAEHRASAAFFRLSRRWSMVGKPLDISGEYKFASGTRDPRDAAHSGTFDQLYPANHDKFGHEDLFGWRNLHNARSLWTLEISKSLHLNFMYDSIWLASPRDAIYNGSGAPIARSAEGTAGRHVGEETDVFATYKHGPFLLGAGIGHYFAGRFIRNTTPGVGPEYYYLFHTYSF